MTFSTLVTPTRESETCSPGTCACTSSSTGEGSRKSDIGLPKRLAGRPNWTNRGLAVLVLFVIGATKLDEARTTHLFGVTGPPRRVSQMRTAAARLQTNP